MYSLAPNLGTLVLPFSHYNARAWPLAAVIKRVKRKRRLANRVRSKEFEDRPSIMLKRLLCIAILGLFVAPPDANAQGYPLRPITVVVPFPAGGPSDVVARIVTEQMGTILG